MLHVVVGLLDLAHALLMIFVTQNLSCAFLYGESMIIICHFPLMKQERDEEEVLFKRGLPSYTFHLKLYSIFFAFAG